jgi:CRP/FNR family transcriptional regulator
MSPNKAGFQSVDPFSYLDEDSLQQLRNCAIQRNITNEAFLSSIGDAWPYLVYLVSGAVEAIKESLEGRSLLVLTLKPGDVFWGVTFFENNLRMPVSLRASQDSELLLWHHRDVMPVLIDNPEALWSLTRLVMRRVQIASDIVEDLAFQPVAGRLAKLLLEEYPAQGVVARDLTLDELAARVGSTREMVCRVLYRLADDSLIHITRTEFSLLDLSGLRQTAGLTADRDHYPPEKA